MTAMERYDVTRSADSPASADAVWAIARDFCAAWHPLIASIHAEHDESGHLIRAFTVSGEEKVYRERLTYFSDTERTLRYTHLAGINGVDAYEGRLSVSETATGSLIEMAASFAAEPERGAAIRDGTGAIFEAGLAALAKQAERAVSLGRPAAVASPVRTGTFMLDGTPRLAVTATPDHSGPLCLFLHGIGGNRSNWDAQIAAVAPYMRASAMDLRGYGDSEAGAAPTGVEDYCADILRVAEALGATRLVLCGLSYGAWIAASFAMRHPDMLAGLVLSGGCTGMSEAPDAVRIGFRNTRTAQLDAGKTPADLANDVVAGLLGPEAGPAARDALLASMRAIPTATYRDAVHCFTHPAETLDFSRFDMPVLMMTGAYDRLAPPAEIRSVAERIHQHAFTPDVRFEVIEGAGHVCNLEQPDHYNAPLLDLVARLAR